MSERPTHKIIIKDEADEKWTEVVAGRQKAKGSISIRFKENVRSGTHALMVKNLPKTQPVNGYGYYM